MAQSKRIPPPWAEQLEQFFGDTGYSVVGKPTAAWPSNDETSEGFLIALAPLIAAARGHLHQALLALLSRFPNHPINDPAALEGMLYTTVRHILRQMVTPTLVLELNVARLNGKLEGETPEARFDAFIQQLAQPETIRPIIAEYPVLFRLAAERLETWHHVSLELVERLCRDWEALYATFAPGRQPTPLTGLSRAQGSTKRGGRAVVAFEFADGLKVVYKPRSLALESHFQALLCWLEEHGYPFDFRPLQLLERGTYGWVAWVEAAECSTEVEVQRFYQRQGAYLALLYALEATDFHLSNIIAVGEYPLFIDLEALFHPRDADPNWQPLELALDALTYRSVLRLGLLPEPELGADETLDPIDYSGLGGKAGQETPDAAPTWEDRGTDMMRLAYKRRRIKGDKNLPVLDGRPALAVDYHRDIEDGFSMMYRFLMQHRDALLAADGLLACFADDEVRVLPRSGQRYGRLLEQSFHPDLMRDTVKRERFLDRLWADVEEEPHMARLIAHEQADLWVGDIPLFTTHGDSQDIFSSNGKAIPDFFPRSGLAAAVERIATLNETDLERQRWFIRASLATVTEMQGSRGAEEQGRLEIRDWGTGSTVNGQWLIVNELPGIGVAKRELLEEARRIGEWLEEWAVRADGEASWVGLELSEGGHWQIEALDTDLHSGLPGVALFLAHLGALTGEVRWTRLARAAVAAFERLLVEEYGEELDPLSPIGAFNGLGGQLYTLAHLGTLWQDGSLLHTAETYVEIADLLLEDIAEDEEVGLAEGLSGCLAGLLAVYQAVPSPRTLEVTRRAGDELLNCLEYSPGKATTSLEDYWYGRASTVGPLQRLAAITGESRYHVEQSSNGLQAVFPEVLGQGLGHDHSLGTGAMGYLELLLQAAVALDDAQLYDLCNRYGAAVVAAVQADGQDNGWRCATPLHVVTPGLMAGLAGIGYTLLRLAAPQRVPSLLALEIPVGGKQ